MFSATTRPRLSKYLFMLCVGLGAQLLTPSARVHCLEDRWRYEGAYEGVKLYRPAVEEKEGLLPFMAVAELDVAYDKIVMALVDAERKADWAPKLKSIAIHSVVSPNCFEYSEYYETPWPFKDREFLLTGTVDYRQDRIVFSAVNATRRELARKDHVLAHIELLTFEIIPVSANKTKVSFAFSGDLGGRIPAFVKNIIQKKWPVRFIQSLNARIATHESLETDRYLALRKTQLAIPMQ